MTEWEIVRAFCYVILAPLLMRRALRMRRLGRKALGIFYGALGVLFAWYVVELALIAGGVNTREYRVLATPLILAITTGIVLDEVYWVWRQGRTEGQ